MICFGFAPAMNVTPLEKRDAANAHQPDARPGRSAQPASEATPLLWLTVLSLDAPVVAVLWQLLFAQSFQVRLGAGVTILLALVVWLIYVADRVLDALRSPSHAAEARRHMFYRGHLWSFLFLLCAGSALAAWLALTQLDVRTFGDGVLVLFAVGVYLLLVHLESPRSRSVLPKEMLVGILFALGTCFAVWQKMTESSTMLVPPCAVFAVLCWLNCAAIECAEWHSLRGRRFGLPHTWTVWMGKRFMLLSFIPAATAAIYLISGHGRLHWQLAAAELLSALVLSLISYKEESLPIDQFRLLVDVALFTPILFLLV